MSPTVFGSDGEVLTPEAAEVVGDLEVDLRAWSMLWGAVSLKRVRDVAEAINAQIERRGPGRRQRAHPARQCGGNYVVPLTLLPSIGAKIRDGVSSARRALRLLRTRATSAP